MASGPLSKVGEHEILNKFGFWSFPSSVQIFGEKEGKRKRKEKGEKGEGDSYSASRGGATRRLRRRRTASPSSPRMPAATPPLRRSPLSHLHRSRTAIKPGVAASLLLSAGDPEATLLPNPGHAVAVSPPLSNSFRTHTPHSSAHALVQRAEPEKHRSVAVTFSSPVSSRRAARSRLAVVRPPRSSSRPSLPRSGFHSSSACSCAHVLSLSSSVLVGTGKPSPDSAATDDLAADNPLPPLLHPGVRAHHFEVRSVVV